MTRCSLYWNTCDVELKQRWPFWTKTVIVPPEVWQGFDTFSMYLQIGQCLSLGHINVKLLAILVWGLKLYECPLFHSYADAKTTILISKSGRFPLVVLQSCVRTGFDFGWIIFIEKWCWCVVVLHGHLENIPVSTCGNWPALVDHKYTTSRTRYFELTFVLHFGALAVGWLLLGLDLECGVLSIQSIGSSETYWWLSDHSRPSPPPSSILLPPRVT